VAIDWSTDLFWSIDPGESKCGVAIFHRGRCVQALQSTPDVCLDKLWEHLGFGAPVARPAGLVIERFALRPDLAHQQTGSEMGTSQMIGAVRWMARHRSTPLVVQTPSQAHSLEKSAAWKDRPLRWWASYGHGRDAKMAELHGYFRISTSMSGASERARWLAALGTE